MPVLHPYLLDYGITTKFAIIVYELSTLSPNMVRMNHDKLINEDAILAGHDNTAALRRSDRTFALAVAVWALLTIASILYVDGQLRAAYMDAPFYRTTTLEFQVNSSVNSLWHQTCESVVNADVEYQGFPLNSILDNLQLRSDYWVQSSVTTYVEYETCNYANNKIVTGADLFQMGISIEGIRFTMEPWSIDAFNPAYYTYWSMVMSDSANVTIEVPECWNDWWPDDWPGVIVVSDDIPDNYLCGTVAILATYEYWLDDIIDCTDIIELLYGETINTQYRKDLPVVGVTNMVNTIVWSVGFASSVNFANMQINIGKSTSIVPDFHIYNTNITDALYARQSYLVSLYNTRVDRSRFGTKASTRAQLDYNAAMNTLTIYSGLLQYPVYDSTSMSNDMMYATLGGIIAAKLGSVITEYHPDVYETMLECLQPYLPAGADAELAYNAWIVYKSLVIMQVATTINLQAFSSLYCSTNANVEVDFIDLLGWYNNRAIPC